MKLSNLLGLAFIALNNTFLRTAEAAGTEKPIFTPDDNNCLFTTYKEGAVPLNRIFQEHCYFENYQNFLPGVEAVRDSDLPHLPEDAEILSIALAGHTVSHGINECSVRYNSRMVRFLSEGKPLSVTTEKSLTISPGCRVDQGIFIASDGQSLPCAKLDINPSWAERVSTQEERNKTSEFTLYLDR